MTNKFLNKKTFIKQKAFSLAEAMIILLITSVTLAATAPIITRNHDEINCFWTQLTNGGIYYNDGETQQVWPVAIGTNTLEESEKNNPLTIAVPKASDLPQNPKILLQDNTRNEIARIVFHRNKNIGIGRLTLNHNLSGKHNIELGRRPNNPKASTGSYNLGFGTDSCNFTSGSYNISSGYRNLYLNTTGSYNIASGYQALYNNSGNQNIAFGNEALYTNSGNQNIAIGYEPLHNNSGNYNVGLGYSAMYSNTTGSNNIGLGYKTLYSNTTGNNNVATGYQALYSNTTGNGNIANGYQTLYSNTTGYNNIAIGNNTLYSNTEGYHNIAVGNNALKTNIYGDYNIALGYDVLKYNQYGNNNISMGYNTLARGTKGNYNIAMGVQASNSSEQTNTENFSGNIALGYQSLYSNLIGYYNIATGYQALYSNIINNKNIAFGYQALYSNTTGINNNAFGAQALYNNNGTGNIALGTSSLYSNTTGNYNVATGYASLYTNREGTNNIAFGTQTLYNNNGSDNVAIGNTSSTSITTGNYNVAFGYNSLREFTDLTPTTAVGNSNNNTVIGSNTFYQNEIPLGNTAIGSSAFYSGIYTISIGYDSEAYGDDNVYVIGANTEAAPWDIVNVYANNRGAIAIGANAQAKADTSTSVGSLVPNNYIAIGYNALATGTYGGSIAIGSGASALENYSIAIGKNTNTTGLGSVAIGPNAQATGNYSISIYNDTNQPDKLNIGNIIFTDTITGGGTRYASEFQDFVYDLCATDDGISYSGNVLRVNRPIHLHKATAIGAVISDRRLKNIKADFKGGLKQIELLQPKIFTWKNDKSKLPQVGVIAQELQKVFPSAVFKDSDGHLVIRTEEIQYSMLNAIKELHQILKNLRDNVLVIKKKKIKDEIKVVNIQKENKNLKKQIQEISETNNKMRKENIAMKNQINDFSKRLAKLEK